ncbi:MAG: relaxase/mobilization nuclease domain-containing protein [Pseudomonadota bacterium]
MILKASQRGGGKQFAMHLLRADENEHVDVHELRGFMSDDLTGALKEAHAVSRGTKCKQFLFSVSLNPPQDKNVAVETFENAITRIEEKNGLAGHPRAVVFHEKEGRRHAHAVWSRTDAETMTAKNLPYFKTKLRDLSREIYLEQGWQLPKGLMNSAARDPRNFTLADWQQAKREGVHAHDLKTMMAECWSASDSRRAFAQALSERGMVLAKGDRRGHVAVTHDGNILSVARYAGKTTKEIRARLGDAQDLPGVADAKEKLATQMSDAVQRHIQEAKAKHQARMAPIDKQRRAMTEDHRAERANLADKQRTRWLLETKERAARFPRGFSGLWSRVTGDYARIRVQNEKDAYLALQRDRAQHQRLIDAQLTERRKLQADIQAVRREHATLLLKLRGDKNRYATLQKDAQQDLTTSFKEIQDRTKRRVSETYRERLNAAQPSRPIRPRSRSPRPRDHDRER